MIISATLIVAETCLEAVQLCGISGSAGPLNMQCSRFSQIFFFAYKYSDFKNLSSSSLPVAFSCRNLVFLFPHRRAGDFEKKGNGMGTLYIPVLINDYFYNDEDTRR